MSEDTVCCEPPVEVDGIDMQLALRNVGGLSSLLLRVRRRFVAAYRDGLPVLLDLGGDEQEVLSRWSHACHSVRGALSTIGAARLNTQVVELERELREAGSRASLIAKGRELHLAILTLAARLAEEPARGDAVPASASPASPPACCRQDPARLAELRRLFVADVDQDTGYDAITRRLANTLDVPIALVNVLDGERDRFRPLAGVGGGEDRKDAPMADSFCEAFFDTQSDLITVEDTLKDARFLDHPFVRGVPFVRFYAASRLVVDGQLVGTLCAFDSRPKAVSHDQVAALRTLSAEVTGLMLARDVCRG